MSAGEAARRAFGSGADAPDAPWWAQLSELPPDRPAGSASLGTDVADVVVVGSGAAGFTAAIIAADRGCSVAMLEAGEVGGGTTFKSGGGFWIPNNSLMRARGREDDRDETLRYMASLSFPELFDPDAPRFGLPERDYELLTTYFDSASVAVDELIRIGALRVREFQSFSGEYEGMVSYHSDLAEEWGRHLAARAPDGQQELGSGLITQLAAAARERGVELAVRHRVVGVELDDSGAAVGVRVDTPDGERKIAARRGVVFASGGFTHDPDRVERFFRGPIYGGGAVPTNRGDLIGIAEELGAELGNLDQGWLAQVPIEAALERREQDELLVFMPSGDSMVFVDAAGRRVVNEKQMYHERGAIHFARDADGGFPNRLLFMVYDEAVASDPRPWSNPWPAGRSDDPYVMKADTLADLAGEIETRLERLAPHTEGFELQPDFASNLEATIDRFNQMAEAGIDEDFGRGETTHERDWNRPARPGNEAKNPMMFPLAADGPYYAVILVAATLDTNGGPRVNSDAQIVRPDGTPIPGLYGAGNCIASPAAEAYWSGGSTLGPAMTFGYLAGAHVAAEPRRNEE
ncbi:MAG TPA: FAD-dependent oxidoreductase [Solirubrobacterales bacterium]|nr:FAD-dependent oxidoreductase [Solirubrobacterales bacterium]